MLVGSGSTGPQLHLSQIGKSRHPEVALTIEWFWRGASRLCWPRRPESPGFAVIVAALAL
jgi:hypothetical protein